ncbi:class F sortase [Spongiactinospora sp. 9N601]|uniref:class F sortase n=1 Tax=Spongiactinospora sp. 9N601 TaxID=3375149 RepID=UPI00379660E0
MPMNHARSAMPRRFVLSLAGVVVAVAGWACPAAAVGKVAPTRIHIPAIGVNAPVGVLGLQESGVIEVPPLSPRNLTGWYRYGPAPGETGPAVILGHVRTRSGPSVFARLHRLRPGDKILIERAAGGSVTFTVGHAEQVPKSRFPTARVYGNVPVPALRLITCAGPYNRSTGSHSDNLIVYATADPPSSP